jgi:hypothetical protein
MPRTLDSRDVLEDPWDEGSFQVLSHRKSNDRMEWSC